MLFSRKALMVRGENRQSTVKAGDRREESEFVACFFFARSDWLIADVIVLQREDGFLFFHSYIRGTEYSGTEALRTYITVLFFRCTMIALEPNRRRSEDAFGSSVVPVSSALTYALQPFTARLAFMVLHTQTRTASFVPAAVRTVLPS